jgi:hypothetical protein
MKFFGRRRVEMCLSCWQSQGNKKVISFGFDVSQGEKELGE